LSSRNGGKFKIFIAILSLFLMISFVQVAFAKSTDEKIDDLIKNNDDLNKKLGDLWEKTKTSDIKIEFLGTEYSPNQEAIIWLQLLRNYQPINDATCYATAYYPDKTIFLNGTMMNYLSDSDGLYYHDLITPDISGVYMLTATCHIPYDAWTDDFLDYSKLEMYENITVSGSKVTLSNYTQTYAINFTDGTWESSETLGGIGDIEAVDFDLGDISTIGSNIQLCYYASREKTSVIANVSVGSIIKNYNLALPVLAQPTAWYCTNVPKTLFANGVNRIGMGCWKGCTASDNTVIKVDLTSPNNNSYWWENSIQVWHNMSIEDYAIKVIYNRTEQYTSGRIQSIPINLNGSYWSMFLADYSGNVDFKVLNSSNSTLCTSLGDISTCANSITQIKLYAYLTKNVTSPLINRWTVGWTVVTGKEEIRGGGEMHVSPMLNITADISAHNQSVFTKLYAIQDEIANVNTTQNLNFQNLNQNIQSNFTYTNSLITSVNSTLNWWGNFINTTINFWGNALETKIDGIIMGNVTVNALVDYDEIAITVMQYLKALQKQELI
jgi:hypothetical protein